MYFFPIKYFLLIGVICFASFITSPSTAYSLTQAPLVSSIPSSSITVSTNKSSTKQKNKTQSQSQSFWSLLQEPIVAYSLFILGCYLIIIELIYFGMLFPGILGIACLMLSAFGLMNTDYNTYVALFLLILSIGLMSAEIQFPTSGAFLLMGLVVFITGSYWLFSSSTAAVPWGIIVLFGLVNLCFFGAIVYFMKKTHAQKAVSGIDIMLGSRANVVAVNGNELKVRIEGEVWSAKTHTQSIQVGDEVTVKQVNGLTLWVEK